MIDGLMMMAGLLLPGPAGEVLPGADAVSDAVHDAASGGFGAALAAAMGADSAPEAAARMVEPSFGEEDDVLLLLVAPPMVPVAVVPVAVADTTVVPEGAGRLDAGGGEGPGQRETRATLRAVMLASSLPAQGEARGSARPAAKVRLPVTGPDAGQAAGSPRLAAVLPRDERRLPVAKPAVAGVDAGVVMTNLPAVPVAVGVAPAVEVTPLAVGAEPAARLVPPVVAQVAEVQVAKAVAPVVGSPAVIEAMVDVERQGGGAVSAVRVMPPQALLMPPQALLMPAEALLPAPRALGGLPKAEAVLPTAVAVLPTAVAVTGQPAAPAAAVPLRVAATPVDPPRVDVERGRDRGGAVVMPREIQRFQVVLPVLSGVTAGPQRGPGEAGGSVVVPDAGGEARVEQVVSGGSAVVFPAVSGGNSAVRGGSGDGLPVAAALPEAAQALLVDSLALGPVEIGVEGGGQDLRVRLSGSSAAAGAMAAEAPRLLADLAANGVRVQSLAFDGRIEPATDSGAAGQGGFAANPGQQGFAQPGFGRGRTAGATARGLMAEAAPVERQARPGISERYA